LELAIPALRVGIETLVGTLNCRPVRVAKGSIGNKHKALDPVAINAALAGPNFVLKNTRYVDGAAVAWHVVNGG
jgi:acetoacetate decarboxylase